MSITRYGTGSTAGGGQPRPFARAVEADGWLYVSGQVPALDGEIIHGGIVEQTHQTMRNVVAILEEAGYGLEDVVRVGVWLEDPRDFWSFNKVFGEYFKPEHAPARACVQASMMVDCKVEIDCVAYKRRADVRRFVDACSRCRAMARLRSTAKRARGLEIVEGPADLIAASLGLGSGYRDRGNAGFWARREFRDL
ncbi:RidA superfamily protein [Pseudomonas chlororaphis subsp. aureofaciens]|uniref:RidA superfamily protein n=1 Tax=Pseudomonas chlororaphis subsp. aureofaciens TaxID=587851 RepID=A0AAD0ZEL7_9PSED|nr:RidA superfamily protein [Pseudomonas chlororaphis subsp. aureofaciens]